MDACTPHCYHPNTHCPVPLERADDRVEEVVVTGEPAERGKPPEFEFLMHVYDSRRKGMKLYKDGRYEEAFPLLLQAAKRGFKLAQVRVAHLYANGIGTPPAICEPE